VFNLFECFLVFAGPWREFFVTFLFGELIKDTCMFSKVWEKDVEIAYEPQETPYLFQGCC
jgi:hypothetical protein